MSIKEKLTDLEEKLYQEWNQCITKAQVMKNQGDEAYKGERSKGETIAHMRAIVEAASRVADPLAFMKAQHIRCQTFTSSLFNQLVEVPSLGLPMEERKPRENKIKDNLQKYRNQLMAIEKVLNRLGYTIEELKEKVL